jgi:protein Tex
MICFVAAKEYSLEINANQEIVNRICSELSLQENFVRNTVTLFEGGATVPFVARYRKEMTGNMNDVTLLVVHERLRYFRELEERRQTVLRSIEEQGKLDEELKARILGCFSKNELEDLYLPFKPKRKTKASVAIEKGLEPLARFIYEQVPGEQGIESFADTFINAEKGVNTREEAMEGALHIVAEWVSDNPDFRKHVRDLMIEEGMVVSRAAKPDQAGKTKYDMYFEFKEPVNKIPSHRMLAVRRGAKESVLVFAIELEDAKPIEYLLQSAIKDRQSVFAPHLESAIRDSYQRLLNPSVQTDVRLMLKEKSDAEAVQVFQKNLTYLLLQPPAGKMSVIGIDPGIRTGCKLAVVDETGKFIESATIYPFEPKNDLEGSTAILMALIARHNIHAIAVGNGTASRETEAFVRGILQENKLDQLFSVTVNEAGASVYSASEIAREEFPDLDVTIRGAISIARRLQDPLAELVKVDPRSLGVGQYQHDVDQNLLRRFLHQTVESCVNQVGVELNTASFALLRYVSGINGRLARRIMDFRNQNGRFNSRAELMKIPGFGEKTFEQAAGFLRIGDSENPLDRTAVHPESYPIVERMAGELNISLAELIGNSEKVNTIDLKSFETETVGSYTLNDIREELLRPGRDPREKFVAPHFREDVREIGDLKEGMVLEGTVSNVANFGAFVDIGVHQDGLVHISQLSNRYIKDPTQAVKVGDIVKVKVLGVDVEQKRISLSMRALLPPAPAHRRRKKGGSKSKGGERRPPVQAGDGRPPSAHQRTSEGRERRPRPPKRPHREGRPRQAVSPQQSMQQPTSSAQRAPDLSMEERIALLQAKFRPIR